MPGENPAEGEVTSFVDPGGCGQCRCDLRETGDPGTHDLVLSSRYCESHGVGETSAWQS